MHMEHIASILFEVTGTTIAYAQECGQGAFCALSDGFNQVVGSNFSLATGDFGQVVNSIYKLSIRIAGAVAVAMFVWGGITYMVAPFGVAGEGLGRAKERMKNAIIGLLMLLATWVIFNQINPDILNLTIKADSVAPLGTPDNTNSGQGGTVRLNDGSGDCGTVDQMGNTTGSSPCPN